MASFLPVSEIAHIGRQLADTLGAARRLYAVDREPVKITDGPGVGAGRRSGGAAIALEAVTYTYPGRLEPAILRHKSRDSGRLDRGSRRSQRCRKDDTGPSADALLGSR